MPTETRTVREDHAVRVRCDVHVGDDLVRSAADIGCNAAWYGCCTGIVDEAGARGLRLWMLDRKELHRRSIVQREHEVLVGLFEPRRNELFEFLRMFTR